MRYLLLSLALLCGAPLPASAQVSVNIGINLPLYPELVLVPGYPVYYAPRLPSNFFFYDGYYWVYADDDWFVSSWYNGPWELVEPEYVPLFVLRVPVRYYRSPPPYFRGWRAEAPPRWGERWGNVWEREHHGWDHWDRHAAPSAAPLPSYQRQYSGARYPRYVEQQQELHDRNYRYQPRDPAVRHNDQTAPAPRAAQPSMRQPDQGRDDRRAPQPQSDRQPDRQPSRQPDRQSDGQRDHQRGDQRNEQRRDQRDEPRSEMQQPGGSMRQPGQSPRATVGPEARPVPYQSTAPRESSRESSRETTREPERQHGREPVRDSGREQSRDQPRGQSRDQSRDQDDDRQPGRR
jgi:hypothetical protein